MRFAVGYSRAMSFNSERGIVEKYQKNYGMVLWCGTNVRLCEFVGSDFIGARLESIVLEYDVVELRLVGITAEVNGLVILYVPCDGEMQMRGHVGFGLKVSAEYLHRCVGCTVTDMWFDEGIIRLAFDEDISKRHLMLQFKWTPLVPDDEG